MRVRQNAPRFCRWMIIALIAVAVAAQTAPSARADGDLLDQLNKQQDKLKWLQEQYSLAENDFQRVQIETAEAQVRLEQVTQEAKDADANYIFLRGQLAAAQAELKKVEGELQAAAERYAQKKATLAKRIRSINEEGRVSYLSVLFGSTTFSDFISRFDMLKAVVKQDSELFAQVRQEKKELEDKKVLADKRRIEMEALAAQAAERKQVAEAKRDEQEQVSRSLEVSRRNLLAQLDELERQQQQTRDEIDALIMRMNRQGGAFAPIYPLRGRIVITDDFGPRIHPILGVPRNHWGTDFAANMGDPVYAIEAGVVVTAGWDDAYGNLIVIDHGGGISSWYGHSSKLLVSVGEHVEQGQQISRAGSTGWSTGPHVHLEIHMSGTAVDPMSYLPQ